LSRPDGGVKAAPLTVAIAPWRRGAAAWDRAVEAYRADSDAMQKLVADPATDLLAPLPHAAGYTVLREALLAADHAAYHLGQLVVVRRLLGCWSEEG
jgi:hypothetical protein